MSLEFLDSQGLGIYDDEIKNYIKKQIDASLAETVIQEDSFYKFPSVGKENAIYIDTTLNKIYRWNDTDLKYYTVFDHYDDISLIDTNF